MRSQHGAKAVYDFVIAKEIALNKSISNLDTSLDSTNGNVTALTNKVNALESNTNNTLATKLDTAKIKVLTGETLGINPGESKVANIPYPSGFTQANTVIIGKMISSANNYYDTPSSVETQNGFVNITMIALTADYVKVWFKNIDADAALIGHYKITLMRID